MRIILSLFFLLSIKGIYAQDTLVSQDLTSAGDTFVLSIGTAFTGLDVVASGANFSWDYSQLGRTGQRMDTILDPTSTNTLFSFFFINSPFNVNRSNQATRGQTFQLLGISLSDVFNYSYNSSTEFSQKGFGAVVNGIPLPIAYSPHDIQYRFPLTFNDADTVSFGYEIDLTTTIGIFFKVNKTRENIVDGWGVLTTPFGTFDVLRVKSTIIERDSIYIDSLGFGYNLPAITTREYKWMGKGFGLPLLQINTTAGNTVTSITYQDSVRVNSINDDLIFNNEPLVFPNPASKNIFIRYTLNLPGEIEFNLLNSEGRLVLTRNESVKKVGENIEILDISSLNLAVGTYFIQVKSGKSAYTKQVQIN